jgi:hypothetical protein
MFLKKRFIIWILPGIMELLLAVEMMLRLLGFGMPVRYVFHPTAQYAPAPYQFTIRLGNIIYTNSFGMRSEEPDSSKIRILKVGDSILNGGSYIGNTSLSSFRLEDSLSVSCDVQVLNISSGSWGPDNALAFLRHNGYFGAKFAVLVFSSHDVSDTIEAYSPVGVHPDFPYKNYPLGLLELIQRYIFKVPQAQEQLGAIKKDNYHGVSMNPGFKNLVAYFRERHIPVVLYLHPTRSELEQGELGFGGRAILQHMDALSVPCISGLSFMRVSGYRDGIHLNDDGQEMLTSGVLHLLREAGLLAQICSADAYP